MRGKTKLHGIGVVMVVFGMAGLAEISTSSHGSFWFCTLLTAIGFGLCLSGYLK